MPFGQAHPSIYTTLMSSKISMETQKKNSPNLAANTLAWACKFNIQLHWHAWRTKWLLLKQETWWLCEEMRIWESASYFKIRKLEIFQWITILHICHPSDGKIQYLYMRFLKHFIYILLQNISKSCPNTFKIQCGIKQTE